MAEGGALDGTWGHAGRNLELLGCQGGHSTGHLDPALPPTRWVAPSSLYPSRGGGVQR